MHDDDCGVLDVYDGHDRFAGGSYNESMVMSPELPILMLEISCPRRHDARTKITSYGSGGPLANFPSSPLPLLR